MNYLIIGPPGAGKGTQAEKLKIEKNMVHLSTGDIFRTNINNKTKIGLIAKEYIDKGEYVPDKVTIEMIKEYIDQVKDKDILFDGFPRNVNQAEILNQILSEKNQKIDKVINLEIDDEIIIKRISGRLTCLNCGASFNTYFNPPKVKNICDVCSNNLIIRKDDNKKAIKTRLKEYNSKTKPLIDFYKDILYSIDGSQNPEQITKQIINVIDKK